MAAPDLVAGALHQKPVGGEPGAQPPPDRGDLTLVVLAQHVRRPDEGGAAGQRDLEAAVDEGEPLALVRLRCRDPLRIDLDADDRRARLGGAQALQQLDGGPGGGAVSEVDRDGESERRKAGPCVAAIQRSMRRSRFGLVVPRVAVPMGRMTASLTIPRARAGRGDAP